MFDGPLLAEALKIPFTYCWSPALVPKPEDWGSHIGQSVFGVQEMRPCQECVCVADNGVFQMFAGSSSARHLSTSHLMI